VTIVELRYLAEKGTLTEADVDALHAVLQAEGTSFEVAPVDQCQGDERFGGSSRDSERQSR